MKPRSESYTIELLLLECCRDSDPNFKFPQLQVHLSIHYQRNLTSSFGLTSFHDNIMQINRSENLFIYIYSSGLQKSSIKIIYNYVRTFCFFHLVISTAKLLAPNSVLQSYKSNNYNNYLPLTLSWEDVTLILHSSSYSLHILGHNCYFQTRVIMIISQADLPGYIWLSSSIDPAIDALCDADHQYLIVAVALLQCYYQ